MHALCTTSVSGSLRHCARAQIVLMRDWQIPIGELKVGLARHRVLLFKFLADSSNLKCRILRGSYTG